jgi:hypothetical protein
MSKSRRKAFLDVRVNSPLSNGLKKFLNRGKMS